MLRPLTLVILIGCDLGKPVAGPSPIAACTGKLIEVTKGGITTQTVSCPQIDCPDRNARCTFSSHVGGCACTEVYVDPSSKETIAHCTMPSDCHLELYEPQSPAGGSPTSWGSSLCKGSCGSGGKCTKVADIFEQDDGTVTKTTKCECK